ncbi:MAG: ATPase domain-containing protein [Candidatus Bathyarchaeia archaeon]
MVYGKTPLGVPGLDEMLGGGIPTGRVVLILGGPGTGKTVMCTQFLVTGLKMGEPGVFVSLDESKSHYYSEMEKFGWNLQGYEDKKMFAFLDATPIRHIPGELKVGKLTIGRKEFSLLSLIEAINAAVREIDAKRLVIDPVTALVFQYPDLVQRRTAMLDLMEALVATGATTLLSTELRTMGVERGVQVEEYLAHGVIVLQTLRIARAFVRVLHVEKMRETDADNQPRPYRITPKGIEVFPKEAVF